MQEVKKIEMIEINDWGKAATLEEIQKNEELCKEKRRLLRKIRREKRDKQILTRIMVVLGYVIVAATAWQIGMMMGLDIQYWIKFMG